MSQIIYTFCDKGGIMRDIKFRVYDKIKHKMIYDDSSITISLSGNIYYPMDGLDAGSRYILMQYIGLKDKTNKDIYEGDIIKINNDGIYEVKFGEYDFEPYWESFYGYYIKNGKFTRGFDIHDVEDKIIKIAGNIYENPELLEEV